MYVIFEHDCHLAQNDQFLESSWCNEYILKMAGDEFYIKLKYFVSNQYVYCKMFFTDCVNNIY